MKAVFEKIHPFAIKGWHYIGFRDWLPAFHPHVEMVYVVSGCVKTVVDGVEHTLREGELSVIFPYVSHSYEKSGAEVLVLIAAPEALAFEDVLRTKRPVCHYIQGSAWYPLMERAVALSAQGNGETARCYAGAALGEFLSRVELKKADRTEDVAVRLLQYCAAHFAEDITLQSVSAALFVSTSYVSRLFARKFKCSFREYINALRMQKARELLADPRQKISDVMYACGFRNQSSFNRVFLEACGMTPRQYRNREDTQKQILQMPLPYDTNEAYINKKTEGSY